MVLRVNAPGLRKAFGGFSVLLQTLVFRESYNYVPGETVTAFVVSRDHESGQACITRADATESASVEATEHFGVIHIFDQKTGILEIGIEECNR